MAPLDALPVAPSMLGAYVLAVLALVMSPGPDTALILRYTMSSGPKVGFATVTGVQIGLLVHTALAALGLSLVIASSPLLFRLIGLAGALYLGWLGLQAFRGAGSAVAINGNRVSPVGVAKALRDALMTNLFNPKVIVLFLALMPNFVVPRRGAVPLQLVTLGIVLIAVNVVWQGGLAFAAEQARRWLGRPPVVRAVNVATGAILVIFAALMLADHFLAL